MGQWNETCGLSGLPIYGGDECYRIVFDENKIDQLAFRGIDNPTDYAKWIKHIEFGKYDDCGRLNGSNELSNISDGTVFVLKYFWDLAPSATPKHAEDCINRKLQSRAGMLELVDELGENSRKTVSNLLWEDECTLIDDEPELYAGFVHVSWWMSMLRKTFYTAAYRGAQSSMQPFIMMNEYICDYTNGQLPHAQGVWLATSAFGASNREIDCSPKLAIFLLALKSAFSVCPQDTQRNRA